MQEIWKDIPGYEGHYQVSSFGRVKSLNRIVYRENGEPNPVRERILKPFLHNNGYLSVNLRSNNRATFHIQRLVAISFYGFKENMHADHINNDKKDNNASNIRWLSPAENLSRRSLPEGENHHQSVFSNKEIVCIINEYNAMISDGFRSPIVFLSKKYKVNYYTISRIVKRETYSNVRI